MACVPRWPAERSPYGPRFAQIISIFDSFLGTATDRCPDPTKLPPLPIEVPDIGVWWTRLDDRWYVGGVLDDAPGKAAGLLLRDEGGAVVAGGVYCFDDGAIRYLASAAVTIDGEVLEGKGRRARPRGAIRCPLRGRPRPSARRRARRARAGAAVT